MHKIRIKASPGQASKLRNGRRVRIRQAMEGEGLALMVSPSTYNIVTRSFAKNKGVEVSLSPEEISANRKVVQAEISDSDSDDSDIMGISGQGIFSKAKKGLKKAGSEIKKGAFTVNKALKSSPVARTIVKEVAPELAGMLAEAGATYVTGNPEVGKLANKGVKKGTQAGLKSEGYGLGKMKDSGIVAKHPFKHLDHAGLGKLEANDETSGFIKRAIDKRYNMPPAPNEKIKDAFNMGGRGMSHHGLSTALIPQPYSANFHMKNMLPPAYQKYSSGHVEPGGKGLYASGRAGRGLYV